MKYGFIGCGNMGSALALALSKTTKDIMLADNFAQKAQSLSVTLGCKCGSNTEVIKDCQRIFLGVKPQMMKGLLDSLSKDLNENKPLIITMAAGISMAQIEQMAGCELPVIRIMPNTPVSVGKGMVLYCANELVDSSTLNSFVQDMSHAGVLDEIPENLIDAGCSVSGCGPAYMYMLIEAIADGAVSCGLPREKAIKYAAATMAGAAQMVLSSGSHPGELKDAVCSPGGSTIAGLKVLEESGFRSAAIDCVVAAFNRNKELGKLSK